MKRLLTIVALVSILSLESFAVGLDSKAMALNTTTAKLSYINSLKDLPIGFSAHSYVNKIGDEEADLARARVLALLLATGFPVWNKYSISTEGASKIGTILPLLLMAQLPMSKFAKGSSSIIINNMIVGLWLGYFASGWKDSDGSFTYKNTFSVFMMGPFVTLYMNEILAMQSFAVLFYVTLKLGLILEKDKWQYGDQKDSQSWTKFGVFPALGAEYFLMRSLAIFASVGYNPLSILEFGVRFNLGK